MPFKSNPYEPKLRLIYSQLSNRNVPLDDISSDILFEFSGNDPVAAVSSQNLAALIPDRVCIIGGGIAGLTAAYEFSRVAQKFGKPRKISLFEKTARLGGRILTHQFNSGAYAELGPMRLPSYHKIALHYVDRFGMPLYTFPTNNPTYHFSRIAQTAARVNSAEAGLELAKAYKRFAAGVRPSLDHFFPPEGVAPPSIGRMDEYFLKGFDDTIRPVGNFGRVVRREHIEMLDLFANRPLSKWGQVVEGMTVREAFIRFVQHCAVRVPGPERIHVPACAEYLWETFGRATGSIWLEHISMAHFLREAKGFAGGGAKFAIAGGFGRLVDAFVDRLKADPRVSINLRQAVMGIELSDDTAKLHSTSPFEAHKSEAFDAVVCAAPASAVARIKFTPALSSAKHNALSSISYLAASKSAALFRERFWELDPTSKQLGGVTYTDLENQQMWYPHDNIMYDDMAGPEVPNEGTTPVRTERLRTPIAVKDLELSKRPAAILAAYMWGENARRFASLSDGERDDQIIRCLDIVHPGSSKQLIDLVHWPWDAQTNPGGGAFAWYQPGQQSRYQEAATAPHSASATSKTKVHFAGEHLGLIQGWIQSAMVTALDAVMRTCSAR
jgi:monoamine oxidase